MKTVRFISARGYKFYLNREPKDLINIRDRIMNLATFNFYDSITIDLSRKGDEDNVFHDNGTEREKN